MIATTSSRRAAFTILEMMIASAVALVILTSSLGILGSSTTSFNTLAPVDEIQDLGRAAVDRIAADARATRASTLIVTTYQAPGTSQGASDAQFFEVTTATVAAGGTVTQSGKTIEYRLEKSTIDADLDGDAGHPVVNDFRLVRINNGVSTTLCNFVKAGGFTVTPVTLSGQTTPSYVTITLTLNTAAVKNEVVYRSIVTEAALRN